MEFYSFGDVVKEIKTASNALFAKQTQFLADIIAIRSYTGHEKPAVERTLKEFKSNRL